MNSWLKFVEEATRPIPGEHNAYLCDEDRWVKWSTARDKRADIWLFGKKYEAWIDSGEGVTVHHYCAA